MSKNKNLNRGKNFERECARYFGGTRVGGLGDNELRKSFDVYTDTHTIECKERQAWPSEKQIRDWWKPLTIHALEMGKSPILCIRIHGERGFWFTALPFSFYKSNLPNPYKIESQGGRDGHS